ncbi:hypothetical protein [Mangrovibacter plantisponsor]|uniref:Phage terminase Nu1 subunit (DNA packaging protein) n=1 Tax=Mangrovibacter plantisponsor TaxID=451513 RepID=A0A317PTI1_9ENTR|nr:hypothetical protein [Mangrovibacter plantisponsor]PWW04973.1 hypothetical protein DES37_11469 [Mangrovibacter plantisponsor]
MKFNISQLAKKYGYDESTVRSWRDVRSMPVDTEENACEWIVENILKPLRDGNVQERIQQERLKKMSAEAATAEIELEQRLGNLIELSYLEQSLSEYFSQMKNYLRSIPQKYYLELFECQDALELKVLLQNIIDEVLNEIGNQEYEFTEELDEQEEITINLEEVDQDDITTKEDETQ